MKEYTVTYQVPTASGGWTGVKIYKCKDGEDYRRIVNLFHAKKIKLLTVNDKPVR